MLYSMDRDDNCTNVDHKIVPEDPGSPDNGQDSRHEGQELAGALGASSDKPNIVGIVHEVTHEVETIHKLEEAADLDQDSVHDGQETSDSAYEADTVIDSPTSTSSTLQMNLSLDSTDQAEINANNFAEEEVQDMAMLPALIADHNDVNDQNLDEDGVQMPFELPAVPPPAAAAEHPIGIRNVDETGYKVCALHSFKHLHTSCPGCSCRCKATKLYVEPPAVEINFVYYSDSEDDSQDYSPEVTFFRK